ncbi:hypothetical protein N7454_009171 [Penicillium verhagenii]|nr:hypothetical protein N7454_009171 [Penicillium verhagenii]
MDGYDGGWWSERCTKWSGREPSPASGRRSARHILLSWEAWSAIKGAKDPRRILLRSTPVSLADIAAMCIVHEGDRGCVLNQKSNRPSTIDATGSPGRLHSNWP